MKKVMRLSLLVFGILCILVGTSSLAMLIAAVVWPSKDPPPDIMTRIWDEGYFCLTALLLPFGVVFVFDATGNRKTG